MTDNDRNPLQGASSSWDLLGAGEALKQLIGPLTLGVGKFLAPRQRRREDRAERENFNDWDEALRTKGYNPTSVELTLGERTEVRVLADKIGGQRNRESIAWETIDHAEDDTLPVDPTLSDPNQDWLERFWRLAENVTDSDMQAFWGLVLSRRVTKKAGFSARALEFLSTLTGDEARDLERLAKCAITIQIDGHQNTGILHAMSLSGPKPWSVQDRLQSEFLAAIGPRRADLFGSIGLFLQSGYAHEFTVRPVGGVFTFSVADQKVRSRVPDRLLDEHQLYHLGHGIGVSPLGKEIFGMLKSQASVGYLSVLKRGLESQGLSFENAV